MKQQRFIDLAQSASIDEFERHLVAFAAGMDFGLVAACLVVESPGREPQFRTIENTPQAYLEASKRVEDSRRDPVLRMLKTTSTPFAYTQDSYIFAGAGDLWEMQAQYGYKTGISVALHLPANRHFLIGMDRTDPLPKGDQGTIRLFAELQLIAVYAQTAAARLIDSPKVVSPSSPLTDRELEVLAWTMEGKSAWEIGQILKISSRTVNFHIENLKVKLDATNKHQAGVKAMRMGLL